MTVSYRNMPTRAFIAQLKRHEGFRAQPYLCPAHVCTIGYGTNLQAHPAFIPWDDLRQAVIRRRLRGVFLRDALRERDMLWTEEQAEAALREEVGVCLAALAVRCPEFVSLAEMGQLPRAEVLLNMAFNLGVDGLLNFKKTLALLNAAIRGDGSYARVASGMLSSRWARQVGRRADELARQMRTGQYAGPYSGEHQ